MRNKKINKKSFRNIILASSVLTTSLAGGLSANADEPTGGTDKAEELSLETVTVTSRFREETVQDIGESINVISSDDIDAAGLVDFGSFATRIPGLDFSNGGPNRNVPRIRGISQAVFLQDALSAQPLISSSINEIPINSPGFNQLDVLLYDMNRVEVLKGPQGTRFGEGASGGAIRYFLNQPNLNEFEANAKITIRSTNNGGMGEDVSGTASFPILKDQLALRVTGFYRQDDGFIDNTLTGEEDTNDIETVGGRASLLFTPNERFTAELFGMFEEGEIGSEYFVTQGPSAVTPGLILTSDDLVIEQPEPDERSEDYHILGAKLRYEFDTFALESITGVFERESVRNAFDPAFTSFLPFVGDPAPLSIVGDVILSQQASTESFSQEVRFISDYEGPFNFVVGGFYRDLEFRNLSDRFSDAAGLSGVTYDGSNTFVLTDETLTQEQKSVFVDASFDVTDKIKLLGGVRYFQEQIDGETTDGFNAPVAAFGLLTPPAPVPADVEIESFLPRASIEYTPTDDILLYASYSKGARNGGINSPTTVGFFVSGGVPIEDVETFDKDEVSAYEVGMKSEWQDGRLILNVAGYYNEFNDIQTFFRDPILGSAATLNGPSAEIFGAEVDVSYAATDWLDLFAKAGYTDAEFVEDNDTNPFDGLAIGADPFDILNGDRLAYTPELSYNLGAQIYWPVGAGQVVTRVDYSHVGEFINNVETQDELDGYERLDLRLGYEADNWSLTAFVENATDDVPVLAVSGLEGTSVGTPRVIGVTLGLNY